MHYRILTCYVSDVDTFMRDPKGMLNNTKEGTLAIFIENIPAFYAISEKRLAKLLELESQLNNQESNVGLDNQLYEDQISVSLRIPKGKFTMYPNWKPNADFQRMAALWGISITQPVTTEELSSFISYWQSEGKAFHQIQWQQKLARSIQIYRARKGSNFRCDINTISEPDNHIPPGFRG